MPATGKGFEQNYNAQAVVVTESMLIVATGMAQVAIDKQQVELVFGIIKSVMRYRQFMLRGLEAVRGEWSLLAMAWNFKRMAAMAA